MTAKHIATINDEEFLALFKKVENHTLLDIHRCYSLWNLAKQASRLGGCIIEVGTYTGGSGVILATAATLLDFTNVYLCDTFKGLVKKSKYDVAYREGMLSASEKDVTLFIDSFGLSYACILSGIFPEETAHYIKDSEVALCHIDVDFYQSAKDVVLWVWPRLVKNGIIVFDDYKMQSHNDTRGHLGITKCVDEFVEQHKDEMLWLYTTEGQAICIKI